jgi:TetR/AcrR family transcriptional regulator, fatty acid metabolism regulator protein
VNLRRPPSADPRFRIPSSSRRGDLCAGSYKPRGCGFETCRPDCRGRHRTIASIGYARASLARIAAHARISKNVISYHFRGKDELVGEVIKEAIAKANEVMVPRITAQRSYAAMLRAYIESDLAFMAAYPNHTIALVNITLAMYASHRENPTMVLLLTNAVGELEEMLRRGQQAGEFRDFSRT